MVISASLFCLTNERTLAARVPGGLKQVNKAMEARCWIGLGRGDARGETSTQLRRRARQLIICRPCRLLRPPVSLAAAGARVLFVLEPQCRL